MTHPQPHPSDRAVRILFVFAWLAGGDEENELRLLVQSLDPARYRLEAIPCLRLEDGSDQTHQSLKAMGIQVDLTAYDLSFDDTVRYLARKLAGYEIVVSCQNVADVYPALELLLYRPPLIEHGRSVVEVLAGPKHFTTRYVGVTKAITAAAAIRTPLRPELARTLPPMLDMSDFHPTTRWAARALFGFDPATLVIGWNGAFNDIQQTEGFLVVAAAVLAGNPGAVFLLVGPLGPFGLAQFARLAQEPTTSGLIRSVTVARTTDALRDVFSALDILVSLSPDDEMNGAVPRAGAARLPVVSIHEAAVSELLSNGETALLVPTSAVPEAIDRLTRDAGLRRRLGDNLWDRVSATRTCDVVAARWAALFEEILAETVAPPPTLFRSFVQGGFESSTHRLRNGRRLDVIAATAHDVHAESDYRQLSSMGLRTLRDGVRWHLIESSPGRYDFSSLLPMMQAAQRAGAQIIWDLLHYGWPDDIDLWRPGFVDRFAAFAKATAQVWRETTDEIPFWCPVNEMSFFAWGGGDVGYLNPFAIGRGLELKVQLVRASIAACHAVRDVDPRARLVHCEPLITVHPNASIPASRQDAEGHHQAQFEALDMLTGRRWPQIGGDSSLLDIVGVNYYPRNQWIHLGPTIDIDHPSYRPLSDLLFETYARFRRPLFIAETGVEDDRRGPWLRHIAAEVRRSRLRGVPVEGLCLYPIMNHPGWDDDRACHNGLLMQQRDDGLRQVDTGLSKALEQVVAACRSDAF